MEGRDGPHGSQGHHLHQIDGSHAQGARWIKTPSSRPCTRIERHFGASFNFLSPLTNRRNRRGNTTDGHGFYSAEISVSHNISVKTVLLTKKIGPKK